MNRFLFYQGSPLAPRECFIDWERHYLFISHLHRAAQHIMNHAECLSLTQEDGGTTRARLKMECCSSMVGSSLFLIDRWFNMYVYF